MAYDNTKLAPPKTKAQKTKAPRHWTPLQKTTFGFRRPEVVKATMDHYGISEAEANERLDKDEEGTEFWINDLYQVQTRPYSFGENFPGGMHINIRRRDGAADLRDWRHFQQIKNEVAGPEREAFEAYPAESRLVDTSNKYHLFVLPAGEFLPLMWNERDVCYEENRDVPGIRQRPL